MAVTWPLVGRDFQLGLLREVLRGGSGDDSGGGGGFVIGGAAGMGKTRLLAEARTIAAQSRCHVVSASATTSTREIPFGAFPQLRPKGGPGHDRLDVLLDVADELCTQAGRRRLVCIVDDANLLDQASVALLRHLAGTRHALLLIAVRQGEQLPDPLHRLWSEGAVDWLELPALRPEDVGVLLQTVLGGTVASRAMVKLHEASGGNPLYLRELVRAGQGQGLLERAGGLWTLDRLPELSAPLADLLRTSLRDLTSAAREVVELVSFEEPVELELVHRVVSREAVEQAESAGVVTLVDSDRRAFLRLAHPLFGELVRAEPGRLRARRLRRALAQSLADTGLRRHRDPLRLALAQVEGLHKIDVEIQMRAIRLAAAAFDHDLVVRLGRATMAAGGGFWAGHAVAEAYAWSGEHAQAEEAFAALEPLAATADEKGLLARNRAGNLYFGLGRTGAAYEVIDAADRELTGSQWMAELGLLRAGIAVCNGYPLRALEFGAAALGGNGPERLRLHQKPGLVTTLTALGNTDAAIAAGEAAIAPLERAADDYPYLIATTKVALTEAYVMHGALSRAEEMAAAGYREALHACADGLRAQWAMASGWVSLAQGRCVAAQRNLSEAVLLLGRHGTLFGRAGRLESLGYLAIAYVLTGDLEAARAALGQAEAIPCEDAFVHSLGLAQAWLTAATPRSGSVPELEARGQALAVAKRARELGGVAFEAVALHTALRLGELGTVPQRLEEIANDHPVPMHRAYAAHASALSDKDALGLDRAAQRFASLGAWLLSAEAAAAACAPHAEVGDLASAHASAAAARDRLGRCEGARGPAMPALMLVPELTRRERETVDLAVSGMSNAAIAARLVLSVRTVESHLYSAYAKLGITNRDELNRLMNPR